MRLSSAQVKIRHIPYANFETKCRFPNSSVFFFSSNNIYFAQKEHIKMKIFETFKCSGQYSSNFSCQLWNEKSIPLQILRHSSLSWKITHVWILSSYFFNFGLKDPIEIWILRLSSALLKICHIPYVIFQTTGQLQEMLDKSVSNVLGEGMQFLDNWISNFCTFHCLSEVIQILHIIFKIWSFVKM